MSPLDSSIPYYPVNAFGPLMKGLVIGGVGIFHVFLAQFAIGGGMLLYYFEGLAQKGSEDARCLVRRPFASETAEGFEEAAHDSPASPEYKTDSTEACGLCHTDLDAAHGDWPVKPTLPFIPGHEAIGLVAAATSSHRSRALTSHTPRRLAV